MDVNTLSVIINLKSRIRRIQNVHASVTRKNKRPPLPCHQLYSESHVLNALMTFNMPHAFLISMPFSIMLLMCALCMQARRRAQTPPDAVCWSAIWQSWQMWEGFLGRGLETPCWQRGGLDEYLWRDAKASGHGCFTNIISKHNPIKRSVGWNSWVAKE